MSHGRLSPNWRSVTPDFFNINQAQKPDHTWLQHIELDGYTPKSKIPSGPEHLIDYFSL